MQAPRRRPARHGARGRPQVPPGAPPPPPAPRPRARARRDRPRRPPAPDPPRRPRARLVPRAARRRIRPTRDAAGRGRPLARSRTRATSCGASCPTAARTSRWPPPSRSAGCSRCRSPSIVRALLRWRAEQFGAERAKQIVAAAARVRRSPRPAGRHRARTTSARSSDATSCSPPRTGPTKVLAPSRPLVDPGRPLPFASATAASKRCSRRASASAAHEVAKRAAVLGPVVALQQTAVPIAVTATTGPVLEGPAVGAPAGAAGDRGRQAHAGRAARGAGADQTSGRAVAGAHADGARPTRSTR